MENRQPITGNPSQSLPGQSSVVQGLSRTGKLKKAATVVGTVALSLAIGLCAVEVMAFEVEAIFACLDRHMWLMLFPLAIIILVWSKMDSQVDYIDRIVDEQSSDADKGMTTGGNLSRTLLAQQQEDSALFPKSSSPEIKMNLKSTGLKYDTASITWSIPGLGLVSNVEDVIESMSAEFVLGDRIGCPARWKLELVYNKIPVSERIFRFFQVFRSTTHYWIGLRLRLLDWPVGFDSIYGLYEARITSGSNAPAIKMPPRNMTLKNMQRKGYHHERFQQVFQDIARMPFDADHGLEVTMDFTMVTVTAKIAMPVSESQADDSPTRVQVELRTVELPMTQQSSEVGQQRNPEQDLVQPDPSK